MPEKSCSPLEGLGAEIRREQLCRRGEDMGTIFL